MLFEGITSICSLCCLKCRLMVISCDLCGESFEEGDEVRCLQNGKHWHTHKCMNNLKDKPKAVILDDNPLSIACYMEDKGTSKEVELDG